MHNNGTCRKFQRVVNVIAKIKTNDSIETAEMVAINNRPRRRIGLNGRNGLNKTSSPPCVPLLCDDTMRP